MLQRQRIAHIRSESKVRICEIVSKLSDNLIENMNYNFKVHLSEHKNSRSGTQNLRPMKSVWTSNILEQDLQRWRNKILSSCPRGSFYCMIGFDCWLSTFLCKYVWHSGDLYSGNQLERKLTLLVFSSFAMRCASSSGIWFLYKYNSFSVCGKK